MKNKASHNKPAHKLHPLSYPVVPPAIPSGEVYYFTTDSGVMYEVRYGKIHDTLSRVINFNVLNEEFEDEYSMTNRGELYRVVSTVIETLSIYLNVNPLVSSFEFSGEFKAERDPGPASIRTKLFYRSISAFLDKTKWHIHLSDNKVVFKRK